MGCVISGVGKCVPRTVVSNDDIAKIVDTSDEWIVKRTGIHERRVALDENTTDLACGAVLEAMSTHGVLLAQGTAPAPAAGPHESETCAAAIDPASVDLLICMTITPDALIPSQAALVRERLGLVNAVAFDLNAACTGCAYGLSVAESMMRASHSAGVSMNRMKRAVVVGAERLSRIVDWDDRSTCVLFGDGAGAVVLDYLEDRRGIFATFMENTDDPDMTLSCSSEYDLSSFPFPAPAASGSHDAEETSHGEHPLGHGPKIAMEGQKVFKFATSAVANAVRAVAERGGISPEDVSLFVPHQANERIIRYVAKRLAIPLSRFQLNIGTHANTSAASALMALADAYGCGRIVRGNYVVLVGFGGGLTSGAVLFEA